MAKRIRKLHSPVWCAGLVWGRTETGQTVIEVALGTRAVQIQLGKAVELR